MLVIGFGDIILDHLVEITDDDILKRYNLQELEMKEVTCEVLQGILNDISECTVTPGGSAQNTLRIIQWLVQTENSTIIFGGIGRDPTGTKLKKLVEQGGVRTKYMVSDQMPTGILICFGMGDVKRCMIFNIGASTTITAAFVRRNEYFLKSADAIIVEGYFLRDRQSVVEEILRQAKLHLKTVVFGLSATYVVTECKEHVQAMIENCTILCGNMDEFGRLAQIERGDERYVVPMCRSYAMRTTDKIVLVTNGDKPVMCFHDVNQMTTMPVPPINGEKDTTGAGDAFLAGFMYGYLLRWSIPACLMAGNWTAAKVITNVGCITKDNGALLKELHAVKNKF